MLKHQKRKTTTSLVKKTATSLVKKTTKPGKEDGNGVHVVKPGDTVNDIAKANGTTADKIASDNKLADKT